MKILGLDFETAGTRSTGHFRAVEVGFAILNTETKRAEVTHGYFLNDLLKEKDLSPQDIENHFEIPKEVTEIHKLTTKDVFENGKSIDFFVTDLVCLPLYDIDAIMVWNGYFFDRPLLFDILDRSVYSEKIAELIKVLKELPWIDLKHDLKFKHKLDHEAADRGILSAYPHMALADVITMFRLFNHTNVNIEDLLKIAESHFVIVRAKTTYDEREKPKKENFRWNPAQKCWWRLMRLNEQFEARQNWTFDVEVLAASPEIVDSYMRY